MTTVHVRPMPEGFRKVPERLWCLPHPIFTDIGPEGITEADRQLARELIEALDEQSKRWYRRTGSKLFDGLL